MIELLMVIVIVGSLATSAIPQLLNFQTEAKVAALQQTLATMRVALKNQTLQAILRCRVTNPTTWQVSVNYFYFVMGIYSMPANDITTQSGNASLEICRTADIPNLGDRKFWSISANETARRYNALGVQTATSLMPANPFAVWSSTYPQQITLVDATNSPLSPCARIAERIASVSTRYHWHLNYLTGVLSAGTDTPGVNECSF